VAKSTYVISSQRAGVGSVIITETTQKTFVTPVSISKESAIVGGAAEMDGQAQVQFAGALAQPGAAWMDGQAQVAFYSAVVGAAQMNGQAQVLFTGASRAYGVARMDGAASMAAVGDSSGSGSFTTGMLQNLRMQDLIGVGIVQTLDDAIVASHSSKTLTQYHWNAVNRIFIHSSPTPIYSWIAVSVQNLTVSLGASEKFTWGRELVQALRVSAAAGVQGIYKKALAQLFKLSDIGGLSHTLPLILTQSINLSLSLAGGISLKLLQKFLIASTSSPAFTYHFALAGRVIISPFIDKLFFALIQQLFTVQPVIGRKFIAGGSLAQLLTVHLALNNKLVLQLTGDLTLSLDQLVHMLYKGDPLLDEVVITALYISPSGTTTTWAVNTRTNAVTEYMNYNFNSFALLNGRYIASSPAGLYELDGDTDNGTSIISELMSGYFQFNEKKMFGIKGAYVAIRGGGRFYLKLISGDGREYVYELKAQPNFMTTKVRIGKGIKTTYMAFDLVTEGQDFDLDSLEFIPMTSGRRV
jgi:hypothetical protein